MTEQHDNAQDRLTGRQWYRFDDWPMALKLIAYCAGLAAALAIGLTVMGYVQAAQGLKQARGIGCCEGFRSKGFGETLGA